jgi:MFS family permease
LSALAALRHGEFARYAVARFLATVAWQMLGVAVGWQVYALTRDPLALGLVGLAQFLPFVTLVLPAGQVADRADRRLVMVAAYVIEAVSAAILIAFTASGSTRVEPVFLAMALFGMGRALWMPTGQAMVPNLVPPALFPSAVALNSTLFQTAVISGPALGGLLYLLGPQVVYGTSLALLCSVVVLMLSLSPQPPRGERRAFRARDVLEGLHFVWHRSALLGAISLDLFAVLFGGATALLPMVASDLLGVGPAGLGMLRTAPGVGAALTAAALAWWPIRRHAGSWMFGGVALFGAATVVFGLSRSLGLSLAALLVLGASDMVRVYVRHMLVQLETPDSIRGRVSAVNSMFIGASNELGEFESGVTARLFGLVPALVLGGAATLVVVLVMRWRFPTLRTMDRFPEPVVDDAETQRVAL